MYENLFYEGFPYYSVGHSLFVIGFVLILDYIFCFHRWDRNVVVIRAIWRLSSVSVSVSHTNSGRTISVSPLVLARACPDYFNGHMLTKL